jgi:hypothetical protein
LRTPILFPEAQWLVVLADRFVVSGGGIERSIAAEHGPPHDALEAELPAVPAAPSPQEARRAIQLLREEWLGQFPFADAASRTNAIAAVLTPFARELFSGGSPLFAIDAPAPGSGKGFIAGSIGLITAGLVPTSTTEPRDEEELRKRITSLLMAGGEVILFDNVKRRIDSGVLAMLLTVQTWSDRLLRQTTLPAIRTTPSGSRPGTTFSSMEKWPGGRYGAASTRGLTAPGCEPGSNTLRFSPG